MDDLLRSYALDHENPILNFELARNYHDDFDYNSAISFYLRAKERTNDVELQIKCIEYIIECFKKLNKDYLIPELEKHYNILIENSKKVVRNKSQLNLEDLKIILHQDICKDKNVDTILREYYTNQDPFNVGVKYQKNDQIVPATLNFIKCVETSEDNFDLQYECLIHIGECLDKMGDKIDFVFDIYKYAISILPKRPEAYYLLANFQNWHKQYQNAYSSCHTALNICDFDSLDFKFKSRYPGKWGLLYELVISSLYCNEPMVTGKVLQDILNDHWEELDEYHQKSSEYLISSFGTGPDEIAITTYDSSKYSQLRYKFPGSENIEKNFSQVYQDMFILSILDGKRNGTFLEIGAAEPFRSNNTALLEKQYDWNGVSIEYQQKLVDQYKEVRSTKIYCLDALDIDYNKFINENFETDIIDYLQLDIDPAKNTYSLLERIPFEKYKFRVITYEHDHYIDVRREWRQKSREYLESKGYFLLVNDISPEGHSSFEDWWVHPDLVDLELFKKMNGNDGKIKKAETFMLTPFTSKENF